MATEPSYNTFAELLPSKGCLLASQFWHSTDMQRYKPFSYIIFYSFLLLITEPCPSYLFQCHVKEVMMSDERVTTAFLNSGWTSWTGRSLSSSACCKRWDHITVLHNLSCIFLAVPITDSLHCVGSVADSECFHSPSASIHRVKTTKNLCHMLWSHVSIGTGTWDGGKHCAGNLHRCNKKFLRSAARSPLPGMY